MANPNQQQVVFRKILYIVLILVLFTVSFLWRKTVMDSLARDDRMRLREELRGDVELTGTVVRLGLTGSRGLATCILWNTAIDKQKKNQWNELEVYVRSLTKLQPHFITPWLFQSWNLAYNVSVESDRVRDKYFYVSRGLELLAEGERQNRYHPDLRWNVGFYLMHKIMMSDETNYQRSLFQLSLIPPNERHPARFYAENGELNWVEFEKFCKEHPQLCRRLKDGIMRDTQFEKKRQFTCAEAKQVVEFLEENYNIPSFYRVDALPPGVPVASLGWDPTKKDVLLDAEARFPLLPPPHDGAYDPEALTTDATVSDETDGYLVAHSWFSYAQEPLPKPDPVLPGNSEPIANPTRERRPRNMTTLIFRNYPAQSRRYIAERLQAEGWYDAEAWDASEWFQDSPGMAGKKFEYGGGKNWSLEAWRRAYGAWRKHGEENLLVFRDAATEQNTREAAERFGKKFRMQPNGAPPQMREEDFATPEEKADFIAARVIYELEFYRRVSNFMHHLVRCEVEATPEAVMCKKYFYAAQKLAHAGSSAEALRTYSEPITVPSVDGWRAEKRSPLEAWRDLVLKREDFRQDNFTQETSAEYELRYLQLYNRLGGQRMKDDLVKAAVVVPLLPVFRSEAFVAPIVCGPFDRLDEKGRPYIEETNKEVVMDRMGLSARKRMPMPTEPLKPMSPPTPEDSSKLEKK